MRDATAIKTATDFGRNSLGNRQMRQAQREPHAESIPVDTPEYVAERILLAARLEPAEQYMEA